MYIGIDQVWLVGQDGQLWSMTNRIVARWKSVSATDLSAVRSTLWLQCT